jgi:hypothetical protein
VLLDHVAERRGDRLVTLDGGVLVDESGSRTGVPHPGHQLRRAGSRSGRKRVASMAEVVKMHLRQTRGLACRPAIRSSALILLCNVQPIAGSVRCNGVALGVVHIENSVLDGPAMRLKLVALLLALAVDMNHTDLRHG